MMRKKLKNTDNALKTIEEIFKIKDLKPTFCGDEDLNNFCDILTEPGTIPNNIAKKYIEKYFFVITKKYFSIYFFAILFGIVPGSVSISQKLFKSSSPQNVGFKSFILKISSIVFKALSVFFNFFLIISLLTSNFTSGNAAA